MNGLIAKGDARSQRQIGAWLLMKKTGDFRREAEDCRRLAAIEVDEDDKSYWLRLAENWEKLAQLAEAPETKSRVVPNSNCKDGVSLTSRKWRGCPLMEILRTASITQCPQCSAAVIAPEWSEHLSDRYVRNIWSCEACGHQFEDTVYFHPDRIKRR